MGGAVRQIVFGDYGVSGGEPAPPAVEASFSTAAIILVVIATMIFAFEIYRFLDLVFLKAIHILAKRPIPDADSFWGNNYQSAHSLAKVS
jgi:hypothetical protein